MTPMIYIGTSGFSYDDWKGPFYPEGTDKKNMLPIYSRHFETVEINSTYYTLPSREAIAGLVKKTPENFSFCVKAHKDMTHLDSHDSSVFDRFLYVMEPLIESGKLGSVLAQFPHSFKRTVKNEDRLADFRDDMADISTTVEFRNSDWYSPETFEMLRDLDLGFCCVDEPAIHGLMPRISVSTSSIAYVRFHGRNDKMWWDHDEAWQRYDYLYSEQELGEWVPKVLALAKECEKTFVFFNNHYKGKSAQNAKMLAQMLNVTLPTYAEEQLTLPE